jgi:acetate kinase
MATRAGSVDPGILLWLLEHEEMPAGELAEALEHGSGLLGLSGTGDMRELLVRADAGDRRARLAVGVYIHSLRGGIAAMTAALGGLDALVFTGGVGERSADVRALATAGLGFLGVAIDAEQNGAAAADREISAPHASAATLVIAAREDLEIARQVRAVLGRAGQA